jgi:hypothetical protein
VGVGRSRRGFNLVLSSLGPCVAIDMAKGASAAHPVWLSVPIGLVRWAAKLGADVRLDRCSPPAASESLPWVSARTH